MSDELISRVNKDGTLEFIYSDENAAMFADQGTSVTQRASHVEPDGDVWIADMNPVLTGVILGPYKTRKAALDAEIEWLKENLFT